MIRIDRRLVCDIQNIENICFSVPWSCSNIESQLAYENVIFCADYDGDKMTGFAIGQSVLDEGELLRIAVLPEYRRKGIARSLMDRFADVCKNRRIKQVFLEVRVSNTPAAALYESFGFESLGIRKSYYDDPVEDAAVYRLLLTSPDM